MFRALGLCLRKPTGPPKWWPRQKLGQRIITALHEILHNNSVPGLDMRRVVFYDVLLHDRQAQVLWDCTASPAKQQEIQKILNALAPQLRYHIADSVTMKYSPRFSFVFAPGKSEEIAIRDALVKAGVAPPTPAPRPYQRRLVDSPVPSKPAISGTGSHVTVSPVPSKPSASGTGTSVTVSPGGMPS
eukprot:RCo029060